MISSQSMKSLDPPPFAQNPAGLEYLTALSYRSGDLGAYLTEIVLGVSRLIESDWSIVTIINLATIVNASANAQNSLSAR